MMAGTERKHETSQGAEAPLGEGISMKGGDEGIKIQESLNQSSVEDVTSSDPVDQNSISYLEYKALDLEGGLVRRAVGSSTGSLMAANGGTVVTGNERSASPTPTTTTRKTASTSTHTSTHNILPVTNTNSSTTGPLGVPSITSKNSSTNDKISSKHTSHPPIMAASATRHLTRRRVLFSILIVLIGCCAATAFIALRIVSENEEQQILFQQQVTDFSKVLLAAWDDYQNTGLWIQESCHEKVSRANMSAISYCGSICTRQDFKELTEYINSKGISYQSVQFMKNVSHDERPIWEGETRAFLQEYYPDLAANYTGFMAVEYVDGILNLIPNPESPFYFPVHYLEPVRDNARAIDLNTYSHPLQTNVIEQALRTWEPAVTGRIRLVQEQTNYAYAIILYHPGANIRNQLRPTSLCLIVIRVPALIERAASLTGGSPGREVYIYDSTPWGTTQHAVYNSGTSTQSRLEQPSNYVFLGAASLKNIHIDENADDHGYAHYVHNIRDANSSSGAMQNQTQAVPLPDISFDELTQGNGKQYRYKASRELKVADRRWTLVVLSVGQAYQAQIVYVVLGGAAILLASIGLAILFYANMGKVESEIAAETAKRNAQSERHLNEYIAHEVRNPLASAMAALSFLTTSVKLPSTPERNQSMGDDLHVIDASLNYIDDLLRNMLDMQRASSKIVSINLSNVDILRDVFEPVAAVLYLRGVDKVNVTIDCPPDLIVKSDRLRLKQIILNLATNSAKFVEKGFIRLVAVVANNNVSIQVEDSGPGVPKDRRGLLFVGFQESLDQMSQGTGVGICLCKHLSELLKGDIYLDEDYNSGFQGLCGSRFVLDLNTPPVVLDESVFHPELVAVVTESEDSCPLPKDGVLAETGEDICRSMDQESSETHSTTITTEPSLPETYRLLFVDDDMMIRKMFARCIQRCCPGWVITEAANGESAIHLVDSNTFDIIFMDQYMASTEKQLLGSETVRALRARGVTSIIVGCSANDVWDLFEEAGADAFLFKPFACQADAMRDELGRIIHDARRLWQ